MKKSLITTISNKNSGELAVRTMSAKARAYYDGTDSIKVYEYTEYLAGPDGDPIIETLYAVDDCGNFTAGLSFKEAEEMLEAWQDACQEEDDD